MLFLSQRLHKIWVGSSNLCVQLVWSLRMMLFLMPRKTFSSVEPYAGLSASGDSTCIFSRDWRKEERPYIGRAFSPARLCWCRSVQNHAGLLHFLFHSFAHTLSKIGYHMLQKPYHFRLGKRVCRHKRRLGELILCRDTSYHFNFLKAEVLWLYRGFRLERLCTCSPWLCRWFAIHASPRRGPI